MIFLSIIPLFLYYFTFYYLSINAPECTAKLKSWKLAKVYFTQTISAWNFWGPRKPISLHTWNLIWTLFWVNTELDTHIEGGSVSAPFTGKAYRIKYLKLIPKKINEDNSTIKTTQQFRCRIFFHFTLFIHICISYDAVTH